jgi:hypothetical protein
MTTQAAGTEVAAAVNPLSLSDDDFLNQPIPGSPSVQEPVQKTQEELDAEAAAAEADRVAAEAAAKESSTVAEAAVKDSKNGLNDVNVQPNTEVNKDGKNDAASASTDPAAATVEAKDGTQKVDPVAATTAKDPAAADSQGAAVNYETFYKQVMAPFKANGKTIELRTPEEAISLMQMGANYTRKMQDIQPHRKTLLMLENNGLLDPDRLSLLIDVEKGNPEAIKKLLKDKGVDPMSIDTSEDSTYLGGNHKVSDEEANFRNALDELSSNPDGKATLQTVNSTWDQASKEVLWKEPQILSVIHQQRENGVYDRITAEVNRRQALGQVPVGTPFLQAYKAVGDAMQAEGKFNDIVAQSPGSAPAAAQPVVTRVVAPKPAVANGDLASAAAATRSTPRKVEKAVNPLSMSDDDFLKQMANRV